MSRPRLMVDRSPRRWTVVDINDSGGPVPSTKGDWWEYNLRAYRRVASVINETRGTCFDNEALAARDPGQAKT